MKFTLYALSCAILLIFLFTGCAHKSLYKQANSHYVGKRYDQAVSKCADALRTKPDYGKAQVLMQDAYRVAVIAHDSRIKELKSSSSKFKYDDVVMEYKALITISQIVKGIPVLRDKKTGREIKIETKDYRQGLDDAKNNAAEYHYQVALTWLRKDGIEEQKSAAKEFKNAMEFVSGYKDAVELYEKSRKAGIKRIAIIPFEDKSNKAWKYGSIAEMVVDEVVSDILNDPSAMEFLEIISRSQLQTVLEEQKLGVSGIVDENTAVDVGNILGVHEMLTGKITQIVYSPVKTERISERYKANVVVDKKKYTDNEGKTRYRNIYGDVYANATTYTRTTSASINGSYKIIDIKTAKLLKSETFVGKSDFYHQWATYTGDKRALKREIRKLVNYHEKQVPVEAEMVNIAAKDLANTLSLTLKRYVK